TWPRSSKMTAAWICDEISVRSASACWASIWEIQHIAARADQTPRPRAEVLRGPRAPPGRDDRLLRAPVVRAADVPRALAARARRPRGRVELPREGDQAGRARSADRSDRAARARGAGQRLRARDRRRSCAPLDVAVALQRPRVGVQHRLRSAEPIVSA